jgi:hypothetical protein
MKKITEEMQELIAKNLPAATAGAMSDFIKDAEKTKEELEKANGDLEIFGIKMSDLNRRFSDLKSKVQDQAFIDQKLEELRSLEEKVSEREKNLDLRIVEIRLECAENRNSKVESLVEKVFGHPSVSVSSYKSKPLVCDPGNGCAQYETGRTFEDETKTTTKSKN